MPSIYHDKVGKTPQQKREPNQDFCFWVWCEPGGLAEEESCDEVNLFLFPDAGHRNMVVCSQEICSTYCVTAKYQFVHLLPACAVHPPPQRTEEKGRREQ